MGINKEIKAWVKRDKFGYQNEMLFKTQGDNLGMKLFTLWGMI